MVWSMIMIMIIAVWKSYRSSMVYTAVHMVLDAMLTMLAIRYPLYADNGHGTYD